MFVRVNFGYLLVLHKTGGWRALSKLSVLEGMKVTSHAEVQFEIL